VSVLKDSLAFLRDFSKRAAPQKKRLETHERKNKTKQRLEMTDTARPPPMSEIPPVSASAALKMNSGGGGGGPDDVVAVAALIDELKVRFDYTICFPLIGFFFFPMVLSF
jgi:hypothetical protein